MKVVYAICAVLCILLLCGAEGVVEQSFLLGSILVLIELFGFMAFTTMALAADKKRGRPPERKKANAEVNQPSIVYHLRRRKSSGRERIG